MSERDSAESSVKMMWFGASKNLCLRIPDSDGPSVPNGPDADKIRFVITATYFKKKSVVNLSQAVVACSFSEQVHIQEG